METKLLYIEEYNQFIHTYKTGQVSAELAGELICKLAAYYSDYNLKLVANQKKLYCVAQDIEAREENGKTISSAKAQAYIAATEQNFDVMDLKAHVSNIENFQSALRALLRSITNEYSYEKNA